MLTLFNNTSFACSRLITKAYSTSFTWGIQTLHKRFHNPIYGIYGYVRFADEIVDTFHGHDKEDLLRRFREDTVKAIEEKISLNPVLNSFQLVVNQYNIEWDLIDSFLKSMEMDLYYDRYEASMYDTYIYGSAEVVGLMCLRVFCEGDAAMYDRLKAPAKSLGAAFQKVNFLRDMKSDYVERGRVYFPGMNFTTFDEEAKKQVEANIQKDFDDAYDGIVQLPNGARMGVYLAYIYYVSLFNKIKQTAAEVVKSERIRVSDRRKIGLLVKTYVKGSLNII
jgi:phytoene/squalene synthetase